MGTAGEAAHSNSKLESPLLASRQPSAGGDGAHEVSGQLESILDDESVPWARRMCAATLVEMRLLVRLAAPAVLVYMINYLMSMSTQIFSGHLGTLELAAASLGNTGIQVFALQRSTEGGAKPPVDGSWLHHGGRRPCRILYLDGDVGGEEDHQEPQEHLHGGARDHRLPPHK